MLRMRGLIMRSVNTALVWFNTCIFRLITTSQYLNVGLSAFFRPYKHIQSVTPGNQRQADCTTSSARHEKKLHLKALLSILHKDHWPTTWNFQIISHLLPQSLVVFQSLDLNGNIRPETSMDYSSYIINLQFWTYKQNQPEILHHLFYQSPHIISGWNNGKAEGWNLEGLDHLSAILLKSISSGDVWNW